MNMGHALRLMSVHVTVLVGRRELEIPLKNTAILKDLFSVYKEFNEVNSATFQSYECKT